LRYAGQSWHRGGHHACEEWIARGNLVVAATQLGGINAMCLYSRSRDGLAELIEFLKSLRSNLIESTSALRLVMAS
jgi:hypothetical protein